MYEAGENQWALGTYSPWRKYLIKLPLLVSSKKDCKDWLPEYETGEKTVLAAMTYFWVLFKDAFHQQNWELLGTLKSQGKKH